jgi:hypothetical protein
MWVIYKNSVQEVGVNKITQEYYRVYEGPLKDKEFYKYDCFNFWIHAYEELIRRLNIEINKLTTEVEKYKKQLKDLNIILDSQPYMTIDGKHYPIDTFVINKSEIKI